MASEPYKNELTEDLDDTPKILVVDDKQANIIALKTVLKGVDAKIHAAESGNEALSLMLRNQYAVVLADVHMPEMDGYELVQLMRKNPETIFTPVIFVTAMNSERKNMQLGYEVGAVDYLFKPIDKVALLSKVNIFLSLYRQVIDLEKSIYYYKKFVGQSGIDTQHDLEYVNKPKVLVVDDREENLFAMRTVLKKLPIELVTVDSGTKAIELLKSTSFAVILLDVQMPNMDGFELAEKIREDEHAKLSPIIFITAISKSQEHVFKGYESGAVDYIFKPVNPDILLSKVMTFTQIHRHRAELQELIREKNDLVYKIKTQNAQLGFMAYHDPLTQSGNRAGFEIQLDRALAKTKRDDKKIAILLVDLDRFKLINDAYGHEFGDLILKEAAQRMQSVIRSTDYVARMGGDEFAIIINDLDSFSDASNVAEHLIKEVAATYVIKNKQLKIGVSIGIACFPVTEQDKENCTPPDLVRNADIAMFKAKEQRNNVYEYYTEEFNAQHKEYLTIESCLKFVVERDELFLLYQPKMNMVKNTIVGAEVLVRWFHPEHGEISPTKFIPIAEHTQMIIPIGNWIIERVFKQMNEWQELLPDDFKMAINISPYQLVDQQFLPTLNQMINKYNIHTNKLEFEITETAVMEDISKINSILQELQTMGITISIDDFGTGYSMLQHLKMLPIHALKIDTEFVRDLHKDKNSAMIIKAIIGLAVNFHLSIYAEGVETKEQEQFLINNGCILAQGYYYSKGIDSDSFKSYLVEHS